jgi:crotonobetainyl-CoA:carnitine CoA-transferase CaiB-like acyl-CoA transferase
MIPSDNFFDVERSRGALAGVRVLDFTSYAAGPIAARFLADWGATVYKVEHPTTGDPMRGVYSTVPEDVGVETELNYIWEHYNRSKKSITINLGHPGSADILRRATPHIDVLITSLRPREIEKFGLEYSDLTRWNNCLIYASLTGYGSAGPDRDLPGFDWGAFWARSGAAHMLSEAGGSPPLWRSAFGDTMAGMALTFGIMAALYEREVSGEGQRVDSSLLGSGLTGMGHDLAGILALNCDFGPEPRQERDPLTLPYRTYDGRWIQLCLLPPDKYWRTLCLATGDHDGAADPSLATFEARLDRKNEVRERLERAFASKPLAAWTEILDAHHIPAAPVLKLGEVVKDEQVAANEFFVTYDHPANGPVRGVSPPVALSRYPVRPTAAPELGQHTEETLLAWGFTWEEITDMKSDGVI